MVRLYGVALLVFAQVAAPHVERLLGAEFVFRSVDGDDALALSAVDDAQLAVVQEVGGAQFGEGLQLQFLADGHGSTEDEAVVHRVGQVDLVWGHHLLHDEALAQGLRVIVLHVLRVASRLETHVLLGGDAHRAHEQGSDKKWFSHS